MSQPSQMAQALAATPAPAKPAESAMARSGVVASRGEFAVLPRFGRQWIQLVGSHAATEIESETYQEMTRLGLSPGGINGLSYGNHRDALTLARAVRCADDLDQPFGTVGDWLKLDIDLLIACSLVYNDARNRLDPIGSGSLTKERIEEIAHSIAKKEIATLVEFGVATLAIYLLTTAEPPSISPTPKFSSGPELPDSSP